VPLTSSVSHDLPKMMSAAKEGLVYICNPNNPTASISPKDEVARFHRGKLRREDDDFGRRSLLPLCRQPRLREHYSARPKSSQPDRRAHFFKDLRHGRPALRLLRCAILGDRAPARAAGLGQHHIMALGRGDGRTSTIPSRFRKAAGLMPRPKRSRSENSRRWATKRFRRRPTSYDRPQTPGRADHRESAKSQSRCRAIIPGHAESTSDLQLVAKRRWKGSWPRFSRVMALKQA